MSKLTKRNKPYHYRECGLDHIWLVGVSEDEDGDVVINAPSKLHNMLAKLIATKTNKLTGKEIRFLRTHAGLSSKDLAQKYLGVAPETVSRWENSENPEISLSSERLLRTMILKELKVYDYEVDHLATSKPKTERLELEPSDKGWKTAA